MNIAIIRQGTGRYLFSVPESVEIKEGDNVKCDTKRGITDGVAYADSLKTDENAVQLIAKLTGAKFPLKSVVGKTVTSVEMFEKPAQEEPAQEPIKLYCVKEYGTGFVEGQIYEFSNGYINAKVGSPCHNNYYGSLGNFFKTHPMLKDCLTPLVSRPAKVGEWVLVTGLCTEDDLSGGMKVGDISNVVRLNDNFGVYIRAHKKSAFGLTEDGPVTLLRNADPQYLVLDGYTPEPEYLNMRVVCVDNGFITNLTVGKVYEVKDGFFYNDAGRKNPSVTGALASLDDMNARHAAKFIEFKGE